MGGPEQAGHLETSAFAFPSDLADEGVEHVLDNLQGRAGVDGITTAFAYHAARDVFPHNPRRKVHLHERGEYFFPPDTSLYKGLRIQPSVNPGALAHDVLAETCRQAAARDLRVRAWTVFLHADRPGDYPDCVTQNAFGDPYEADFCPANPDVRAYVRALVSDVSRYDIATILAESLHYHGLEHGYHHERYFIEPGARARYLLGLCFCRHCLDRAAQTGIDGARVQAAAREEVERAFAGKHVAAAADVERDDLAELAGGELDAYLDVRADTVTTLVAEASQIAADRGKRLVFLELSGAVKGYATGRPTGAPAPEIGWRLGVDLARIAEVCAEVEVAGYAVDVDRLRLDLEGYKQHLGNAELAVALRPSPPDCESAENLGAKVRLARELGVARVDFYHYGFVRFEALDWIHAALEA